MNNILFTLTKEEYGDNYKQHIIEIYKIYIEMADRISQRRMLANTFFLTINTSFLSISSLLKGDNIFWVILTTCLGCTISTAWYYTLNSYRQLNSWKFKVIHAIEEQLPLCAYAYEWAILSSGKNKHDYWPLSHIEKLVPLIYVIIYSQRT